MNAELNTVVESSGAADRGWLAAWLLREGQTVVPRIALFYRQMAALPHSWRRRMRRTLAVSLSGAALLLALAGPIGPSTIQAEGDATEATITVVNGEVAIANNGKCSLMEAIINARATTAGQMKADCRAGNVSGADTVKLPSGGLFVLTAPHNTQHGPTGLPVITTDMTIEGNGSTITRSAAAGTPYFRILDVDPGVTFRLLDTTVSNGYAGDMHSGNRGGGIYSQGRLIITESTITGNQAYSGGGISADEILVIDSVISGNRAEAFGSAGHGGGIEATTAGIQQGSRILNNSAYSYYLGGRGGGIWADWLVLEDTTVAGNIAEGYEEWAGEGGGVGGGVYADDGVISRSTISGNESWAGYDGYSYGSPVPGLGGGVAVTGKVTVANSTVSGNSAHYGGGVFVRGGANITILQSTVTGNDAIFETSGWKYPDSTGGDGGGIFVEAVGTWDGDVCGKATLSGSLISGNTADLAAREIWVDAPIEACTPEVVGDLFNVIGFNGFASVVGFTPGATDLVPSSGLDAMLAPLADNGGPTQTHALVVDSPALDLAPSDSCFETFLNGVDQRGMPRNANGRDGVTDNECDAGSYELQPEGSSGSFLISTTGSGNIDGVAFTPSDILKYDPAAGWSMYFDGSDVGVGKNLWAFDVDENGDILMSFALAQNIPGVGKFMPQDIARFTPTTLGSNTSGSFSWALDGSANLLSTSGEKIDALSFIGDGRIAISTSGTAAVKLPNGTVLKAQDEDALGFNLSNSKWSAYFDGTAIPGLKAEDINALAIDPATGDLYISLLDAFNLSGVKGNAQDIVKLTPSGDPGSYTPSLWWDGSAEGFKSKIDGLTMLP